MKVFCGLPKTPLASPSALAIGNFDGVHIGHKTLLAHLNEKAARYQIPSAVLTFEPHPRLFFAKNRGTLAEAPTIITPLRNKLQSLAATGIDLVILARFNEALARLTANEFIDHILIHTLRIRYLTVGEHFCFGQNREGTTDDLFKASQRYGFELEVMPSVTLNNARISSSSVRQAIEQHDFQRAHHLLGSPYCISGHVIHGDKRGRQLGVPTANLPMRHYNPVLSGVFITQVHGLAPHPLPAVSMIGTRPTIDGDNRVLLETHLLDFEGNCYGSLIHIEFLHKLRENRKFPDLAALSQAIHQDIAQAKAFFSQLSPDIPK